MQIRVTNLQDAIAQANGWATRVISIVDPKTHLPDFTHVDHLVIRCNDVEVFTDPWAPKLDDVRQALDFVRDTDKVLVHCEGGISRSTAYAIGLLVRSGMKTSDAVIHIHDQRPNMWPNKLILSLFDYHLRLGNTLVGQVQDVMNSLPKDMMLWCNECQTHFLDGQGHNCVGGHWL